QSSGDLFQLPIILPQSAEVRSVEAGTSTISGLQVADEAAWKPVYSEKFEAAWRTTQPVAGIPIRSPVRHAVTVSESPDLLLARIQIIGRQVMTTTIAAYQSKPDVIMVETPEDLGVEAIVLGSQSLTSGDLGRNLMQTTRIADRGMIRW